MKNILIVDDSKFVRSVVKKALSNIKNIETNIITSESYAQTKELIQKYDFHASVVDVHLPDAQNGEAIDLLIEQNVPVVVLTGGINEATKKVILDKDIVDYITKSNLQSISYIVAIVQRILNNYEAYVLVVDDSKLMRMKTRQYLEDLHVNVIEASTALEAIDIIKTTDKHIPLVLTDYEMPGMNGMEFTMELRQDYSKDILSIIAISGSNTPKIATNFLKHGANDFIKKPFTHEEFSVRININLELIELFRQSQEAANKDFLTGLYNRRFFFTNAKPTLERAKRKKQSLAIVMLDIDFFKKINDTYGHDVGDIAIQEVGIILNRHLRASDLISRFGGEEFCILMEDVSIEALTQKLETVRNAFETNILCKENKELSYTVSIGVFYGIKDSLEEMIKLSDDALYGAKETGRNKVVIKTDK